MWEWVYICLYYFVTELGSRSVREWGVGVWSGVLPP